MRSLLYEGRWKAPEKESSMKRHRPKHSAPFKAQLLMAVVKGDKTLRIWLNGSSCLVSRPFLL